MLFLFTRVCYQWLWAEGWKLPQKMWCLSSEHRILPFSSGYILLFCPRDPWSKLLQSGWIEEPLIGILIGILNPSLSPLTSGPLLSLENVLPLGLKQPKTPFQYHSPPSKLSFWPALLFIHPVLSASISQEFLNILNPAVSPLLIFLCTYILFCFLKMFIWFKVWAAQSCPPLCDPRDYSPPGSSVHGVLQARLLEWIAISFSSGSSRPSDGSQVSCIAGGFFTVWATRGGCIRSWLQQVGSFAEVRGLLSSCGAQSPEPRDSVVGARGLSCAMACGILVPRPGIKRTEPHVLEGRFLTTRSPGKFLMNLKRYHFYGLGQERLLCVLALGLPNLIQSQGDFLSRVFTFLVTFIWTSSFFSKNTLSKPNWVFQLLNNPLQYSCLENPMDRGAWLTIVCGVAKSQTWLSDYEQISVDHGDGVYFLVRTGFPY